MKLLLSELIENLIDGSSAFYKDYNEIGGELAIPVGNGLQTVKFTALYISSCCSLTIHLIDSCNRTVMVLNIKKLESQVEFFIKNESSSGAMNRHCKCGWYGTDLVGLLSAKVAFAEAIKQACDEIADTVLSLSEQSSGSLE